MKRLFPILLALACTERIKRDSQLNIQETTAKHEQDQRRADSTEAKTQEASQVDTKTTSEDTAVEVEGPDGDLTIAIVTPKTPLHAPRGSKVIGSVAIGPRKVVEQKKDIGASTDLKAAEVNTAKTLDSNGVKTTQEKVHLDKEEDIGPGWKFYLWISLGIILALVAAWATLKFYLKPPWLPRWP